MSQPVCWKGKEENRDPSIPSTGFACVEDWAVLYMQLLSCPVMEDAQQHNNQPVKSDGRWATRTRKFVLTGEQTDVLHYQLEGGMDANC